MGQFLTLSIMCDVLLTSSAAKSLYGTSPKPGMNGPNRSKLVGSVDDEMADSVRPQKFPSAKMILASLSAIFLTS